jgi:hypothetical protein
MDAFDQRDHWSLMQVEYAMDLVFRSAETLKPLYEQLSRQAALSVKAEHVASFLKQEDHAAACLRKSARVSRPASRAPASSIASAKREAKMYDKFHLVLRIETTANDVSFFRRHRRVEHRYGTQQPRTGAAAPLKKTIYEPD